jgi:hypothetical protein
MRRPCGIVSAMKRVPACVAALVIAAAIARGAPYEPFPPKGAYNNSVHRYFPDLDARLNAVRYGRWRALEIAWREGIDRRLDARFSADLLEILKDPPRVAPEAERVAPSFAREALPIFHALHWAQVFEQEVIDILASPDATPRLTSDRLNRLIDLYRREPWVLSAPPDARPSEPVFAAAPASARILSTGTRLFALAAEDLAAADFGEQRWRVRRTVSEFDRASVETGPPAEAAYRAAAPTVLDRYPNVAERLDRISRFRVEVFEALLSGGDSEAARRDRSARLGDVARRYRIPTGRAFPVSPSSAP